MRDYGSPGHSGSRWFTPARIGVSMFIRIGVRSIGCAFGNPGSFCFARFHSGARIGHRFRSELARVHSGVTTARRVHSGSRGFTPARIGVAEFFRSGVRSLGCE